MTEKAKVTKEASIYPKKVWVVYAACQAVALVAGFTMDMESQGASDLVAVVTVPAIICVLVALLCAPVCPCAHCPVFHEEGSGLS